MDKKMTCDCCGNNYEPIVNRWKIYEGINPFKLFAVLINETLKTNREAICAYLTILMVNKNQKIKNLERDYQALREVLAHTEKNDEGL